MVRKGTTMKATAKIELPVGVTLGAGTEAAIDKGASTSSAKVEITDVAKGASSVMVFLEFDVDLVAVLGTVAGPRAAVRVGFERKEPQQ